MYLIIGILSLFLFCGCASTVGYKLDDVSRVNKRMEKTLILNIAQDLRPNIEHEGQSFFAKKIITGDKNYKPNVQSQIAQILVQHIEKSGLFQRVIKSNIDNNIYLDSTKMKELENKGIDYAITADLGHFYGYETAPSAIGVMGGLLGALVDGVANPKVIGAEIEYSNVHIIDLKTQTVVWEGDFNYKFEKKAGMNDAPVSFSLRSLKEANDRFINKIKGLL